MLYQNLIPVSFREIAELIGEAATRSLVEKYGGRDVSIPKEPTPGHPLVGTLGPEAAAKLCERYARERIYVPRLQAIEKAHRDQEIRRQRRKGASIRELALRSGLSERRIKQILQTQKQEIVRGDDAATT